jgi:hypothetical protein
MNFACDDNLGRLARYLRILGFDTFFNEPIADGDLLAVAASQERFLLTRDSRLGEKSHPYGMLLLDKDDPIEQLLAVVKSLDLKILVKDLFTRCSRCNEICHSVTKDEIAERTFPYVLRTQEIIQECPSCKRLYWRGTHYHRLLGKLKLTIPSSNIIGQWPEELS